VAVAEGTDLAEHEECCETVFLCGKIEIHRRIPGGVRMNRMGSLVETDEHEAM